MVSVRCSIQGEPISRASVGVRGVSFCFYEQPNKEIRMISSANFCMEEVWAVRYKKNLNYAIRTACFAAGSLISFLLENFPLNLIYLIQPELHYYVICSTAKVICISSFQCVVAFPGGTKTGIGLQSLCSQSIAGYGRLGLLLVRSGPRPAYSF